MKVRREKSKKEGWKVINKASHHHDLHDIPKIIETGLISWHHDDLLIVHFGSKKKKKIECQKVLQADPPSRRGYVCLVLKAD